MPKSLFEELSPKVLQLVDGGASLTKAAEMVGINQDTIHEWKKRHPEFSDMLHSARMNGKRANVDKGVDALIDLALGKEFEDVKTEYGSELNPQTGKHEPVIKKQVRVKKVIPPNIEALKFFLTNQDPENWKNRQDTQLSGDLLQRFQSVGKVHTNDGSVPTSEDDIPE